MKSTVAETELESRIIDAIRSVTGSGSIALHEPFFGGNEWKYVKDCLDSSYVSSVGLYVDQFENQLSEFTGAKYAIAVVNGTAALHIALEMAGVVRNDEVLIPTMTFVATANSVTYCGATPHFVDSEPQTLGIDSVALREYLTRITELRNGQCINRNTERVIRAVVPMHTFGHPVNIHGILALARDFNLAVVEDAAESLGSTVEGQHTGTFGVLGALSFNGNKTVTTGGGGAVLTNNINLAKRVKHLTTTAKLAHRWEFRHDEIGYNYRLPNINAALGCAQLEQLPIFLEHKRLLASRYAKAFEKIEGVRFFVEPTFARSNYWLNCLLIDKCSFAGRDKVLNATNVNGIMTRPVWTLMHRLPMFANCPRMELSTAEELERRIVNLPSSVGLSLVEKLAKGLN